MRAASEFEKAVERTAATRGVTPGAYVEVALLFAVNADGIVHLDRRGDQLEMCFAPDECAGHG